MSRWQAGVTVWPYHSGNGAKADKGKVGKEHVEFEVTGDDIDQALAQANLFIAGVRTNPAVWRAFVHKLIKL